MGRSPISAAMSLSPNGQLYPKTGDLRPSWSEAEKAGKIARKINATENRAEKATFLMTKEYQEVSYGTIPD